jgi:hypothetical protein
MDHAPGMRLKCILSALNPVSDVLLIHDLITVIDAIGLVATDILHGLSGHSRAVHAPHSCSAKVME